MGRKRAQDAVTVERQIKALDLRKRGYTYRDIAEEIGVSVAQAYKDVNKTLKEVARETAQDVLDIELERLDMLIKGLEPMARTGNPASVNAYLKVMERRAKLLGLDAPDKTDITSGGEKLSIEVVYVNGNPKTATSEPS